MMTEDPWLRAIKAAKGLYDPKADEEQEVDEGQTDFHIDAGGMKFQKSGYFERAVRAKRAGQTLCH